VDRPDSVPAGAIYSEHYGAWGVGETSGEDDVGLWRWFRPDGTLWFEQVYDDAGTLTRTRSYYSDGSPQSDSVVEGGKLVEQWFTIRRDLDWKPMIQRDTTLGWRAVPPNVAVLHKLRDVYPLTYEMSDAVGTAVDGFGLSEAARATVSDRLKALAGLGDADQRLDGFRQVLRDVHAACDPEDTEAFVAALRAPSRAELKRVARR
jgi:hypothetical protein